MSQSKWSTDTHHHASMPASGVMWYCCTCMRSLLPCCARISIDSHRASVTGKTQIACGQVWHHCDVLDGCSWSWTLHSSPEHCVAKLPNKASGGPSTLTATYIQSDCQSQTLYCRPGTSRGGRQSTAYSLHSILGHCSTQQVTSLLYLLGSFSHQRKFVPLMLGLQVRHHRVTHERGAESIPASAQQT